jgi:hypothetical protein
MHTLSKKLSHWLNLWLIVTLMGSLLPPAPLALASSLENNPTAGRSNPYLVSQS